ncbi:NEW3 domain-containing protein [Chloroflexota bacterium]
MSRSKFVYGLLCLILFSGMFGCLTDTKTALANQVSGDNSFLLPLNQEQPLPEEKLTLSCRFPTLHDIADSPFTFEVELTWEGNEPRKFDLAITENPPRWRTAILETTSGKQVSAITIEPGKPYADTLYVALGSMPYELPEPGNYVIVFEVSSGDIKETIELTAVVTAKYMFAFYTEAERLNIEVTAGEENHLSLMVANTGTAKIEDITLNSSKPFGWTITFNPEEINSIEPGLVRSVDAIITAPRKTIAGDYMITMQAIVGKGLIPTRELQIRVSVLTPTIWGWVGILIVLAVIVGLGVMFRRLGRR